MSDHVEILSDPQVILESPTGTVHGLLQRLTCGTCGRVTIIRPIYQGVDTTEWPETKCRYCHADRFGGGLPFGRHQEQGMEVEER